MSEPASPPHPPGDDRSTKQAQAGVHTWLWMAGGAVLALIAALLLRTSPHRLTLTAALAEGAMLIALGVLRRRSAIRIVVRMTAWLGGTEAQTALLLLGPGLALLARAAAGNGPTVLSPAAVPLWAAGIACAVAAGWRRGEGRARLTRADWAEAALVVALAAAAFAVRAWRAGTFPHVLSGDEGSVGLTGWEFVEGARDNPLSLAWFSFPALYFWIVSWFQSVMGRSVEAVRWSSALGGALTVAAVYVCSRRMFGRPLAWVAAAWLTAFHVHIFFSRVAYNNIWDGLIFILAICGWWIGWREGRRWGFLLAGVALGLSPYFYVTAKLTPILIGLWSIVLWRTTPRRPDLAPGILVSTVVAASVAMPLVLLYLSDPASLFFQASRVSILIPGDTAIAAHALGMTPLGLVLEQVWITALGLILAELQGVYFHPGVPMLFGLSMVLFLLGLGLALLRGRDPRSAWMLLALGATLIVGGLSIQAPNAQRMLLLPPVAAILIAWPLDEARRRLPQALPGRAAIGSAAVAALLLVSMAENLDLIFRRYAPHEAYGSLNAEVAQEMGGFVRRHAPAARVYFIGGERMGFHSFPNLPYLYPEIEGQDLLPPFTLEAEDSGDHPTRVFIFLPEQRRALREIQARHGPGVTSARYNRDGRLLFFAVLVP